MEVSLKLQKSSPHSGASPSAWTAKGLGGTMCSSNGYGAASNMRRSICEPTKPSARRELRLAGISTSTTADVHIRVLTAAPRIKPTSTRCHSAWQPKPGRASTYRREDFVQTSGTCSTSQRRLLIVLALLPAFLLGLGSVSFYYWNNPFNVLGYVPELPVGEFQHPNCYCSLHPCRDDNRHPFNHLAGLARRPPSDPRG